MCQDGKQNSLNDFPRVGNGFVRERNESSPGINGIRAVIDGYRTGINGLRVCHNGNRDNRNEDSTGRNDNGGEINGLPAALNGVHGNNTGHAFIVCRASREFLQCLKSHRLCARYRFRS